MHRQLWAVLAFCFLAARSSAAITGIVMTMEGQPVAGARVSIRAFEQAEAARTRLLSTSPDAVPIATTQTDSKGAFSLDSPKDATVDLDLYARGYEPQRRRVERDEELGAIALQKAETRTGTVTAGGKPVAGAKVAVYYDEYEYLTKTDDRGRYEAPDPKRIRSIAVVHPDYAVNNEAFFNMASGTKATALNRTLVAGSPFQGKAVSGEKDTPVAGATIVVDGWPLATTGDDGTFTIARMPAKWKNIIARKDTLLGQRAFSKEAPAPIRLARAATISGRVTDSKTRVPVAGAIVMAGPRRFGPGADSSVSTFTDAKGAYSLLVPAGSYMVIASHPGYDVKPADASAIAGQQTSKDVMLPPLARVSGVVLDESKRPVVVAALDTEDAETSRMGMPPMRRMMQGGDAAISGPDGRFSMRIQPDQDLWVRAKKRGLPSAKSDSFHLAAGERKTGLVLTIPTGIAVGGRAVDTHGDPLSGVAVTATEAEGGQRGMFRMVMGGRQGGEEDAVRTGSDGTFTMRVKEGTYDFTFRREGLAPKTVRGQNISVASAPNVEATMEPSVEITGRVSRAGTGLENVMVMAMTPGSDAASATTGPDGSFTLTGLAPGSVRLMARKTDDFVQETRNVDAPAHDVVIDIPAGGRISGRVVDKGSGKPIPSFQSGITTSRSAGGMVMMAPPQLRSFTSDDGSFTLESVPPGATVLVASSAGYASSRLNLTVEQAKEIKGVELQLDAGVKLTGRVTGSNGSPLGDVEVRVLPSPTGGFATSGAERTATTDTNGEYSIEGLEAGDETVSFSHAKHSAMRKPVTLKGGETRLDVQLASGGRVTGTVVTESGAPVADAEVEAGSGGGYQSARTNANGAFEFESMTPGRYRFTASKSGLAEGVVEDVDVSNGAPVQIVLKAGGTIYGRITGLSAKELAVAQVSASGRSSSADGTVNASGDYRIEGVPGGTVQVQAWSGQGMTGSMKRSGAQTVELAPGGSQQVDIAFRDDVIVSGRITRNGVPLAGATVNFFSRGGSRGSGGAPADNDGQYSVSGLEEGEYNVMVTDAQRMSPYSTTYQVHGSATYDIDYKTGSLRGRVLDVSSNEPLANATVQFRSASTSGDTFRMSRAATTDVNGSFIIDSVSPGTYTVTASKDGYGNEVKDLSVGDSAPPDLELRLSRNAGVTLNVIDARDNRPITARVVAFDMQGRVVDETRMMFFGGGGDDASGVKLSLTPGSYTATVSASGYAPRNISFQSPSTQSVALSPGGTLQLRSKHNESARIRLIDANGLPYPRFSAAPSSRELLPNPGTTTLPNVAAGTYTIQLLQGETVVDSKRVVVGEGQTVTEEI
jgi:protocatechuate 3,4-dioxygenase beta subunit